MYVLVVLYLVSAAVALPTPENLHTNSPSIPAPPELPSDIKEEHDAQVPAPKPSIDPISHEESDAEVSVPEPLVDPIPQAENDAQVSVTKPLISPTSQEENDAKVPEPKPLVDPIPEREHEAQVSEPKPLENPQGDNDAKKPLPEPLVYPIPFDSQEKIWQKFDEIFGPETSDEIITLDSEDLKKLLAIEQIFGSEEAAEYEESLIASKLNKQSENAKEKEEKNEKSEELQKNKDSNEANVPSKPDLVEFDDGIYAEPGVLPWFQDLLPLLNPHHYQLQNHWKPLSAVKEDQPIYIIEVQPKHK